ncbi:fluoride efflux transporter CrcB [Amnibacterium sp.]|uniref:fluoride efflux transporter CrcB n=1 Tax=Amnibacterium sp. TaxID=1872496 RepID=UPI0026323DDC|nr:fluoride efflux transporter CrcB [Amnibacterium sp.]MCU1474675.1 chromosome condensation protein CrcB [Amnibacterium sp.]
MSPALLALVALAGGLGAVARFLLDTAVRSRISTAFPAGTVLINLSGSLLLGLVAGLAGAGALPDALRLVAGTGFLGGYTTFSAASVETVALVAARRPLAALTNALVVPAACVALAAAGLALGSLPG